MSFETILERTLKEEGTWSNDADDAGGATMLGITQATLSAYRGYSVSEDEVRHLSHDEAAAVYRKLFYEGPKINLLPEALQPVVFDWGVNSGPGTSIMGLQQAIDKLDAVPHINVDGGIGPMTLNAVQKTLDAVGASKMLNTIADIRIAFYNNIVARRPDQGKFLGGWTARANRFRH